MLWAIIGDIVGSRFEFANHKNKDFAFFDPACRPTDDTIMTLAVAQALMAAGHTDDQERLRQLSIKYMQELGRRYPDAGYGPMFIKWIFSDDPQPYHSFGNGSAMRISPVGDCAFSEQEAIKMAETISAVSHDHPEGIKGAEAIATAIYLARTGNDKATIRSWIVKEYYPLDFTIAAIRPTYGFYATCQRSVPQAIECFLEATSFTDAIRLAVSLGGDSDTIAAMTGAIAEAYYGIPADVEIQTMHYLDEYQINIIKAWKVFLKERSSDGQN